MRRILILVLTIVCLVFSVSLTFLLEPNDRGTDNERILDDSDTRIEVKLKGEPFVIGIDDLNIEDKNEIKSTGISDIKLNIDKKKNEWNKIADIPVYTVEFLDFDGQIIDVQQVEYGKSATSPVSPEREDYQFIGWNMSFSNVTSNLSVVAQYKDDSTPLLVLDDITVKPGEKDVEVILSVKNNPGILGMTLTLTYDERVMKLNKALNGSSQDDVLALTKSKALNSGCRFIWDGESISSEEVKDGELLLLTFEILDDAVPGEYDISVSYDEGDIIDNNLDELFVSVKSGKLIVND